MAGRRLNKKDKMIVAVFIVFLILVAAGFVFGIYFFSMAGIFKLLGVHYESIWSLVVFSVSFFVLGILFDIFSKAIFVLSVQNVTKKSKILFNRIVIEGVSSWLCLFIVDEFMQSITLSWKAEIIITLILVITEIAFDDEDEQKKN